MAELKSLAQEAINDLLDHLATVSNTYRGVDQSEFSRSSELSRSNTRSGPISERLFSYLSEFSGTVLNPQALQANRFSFLRLIASKENFPVQSDLPPEIQHGTLSDANEKTYIHYIRRKAKWFEPRLRKLLISIVEDINECARKCDDDGAYASQSEHIAELGVDPKTYCLRIRPRFHSVGGTDVCGIKFAPIKDFDRCLAKAVYFQQKDWLEDAPAARYICDFLRATIYADDPFVLSLAFAMFKQRCEGLPRVSNYFIGHEDVEESGRRPSGAAS